jgi:hypothetical protein
MSKLFITELFHRRICHQKASMTLQAIDVFHKVWKTQHQNPEFGPRKGEIQKNLQKSTLAF